MTTASTGWELSVSRFIAAKPDVVWHALTDRAPEWFCPKPWRFEVVKQDRRPGGSAISVMHGPNGEQVRNEGIYLAYEPGKRYVVTDALTADFRPQGPFMVGIWEIEPEGDSTRYTARARHWTEEAMRQHQEMGFEAGWGICADQLKALCEEAVAA
ncbi:SRPBCC family protein [Pedomonas mirosovicensis]|uniref:SRPBCC family protein n=1 Tax=Pedomonas mirosovicensis TaxID=2908641 RepID=UPI0021679CE0|nr:SRPBCC family protein [Pedomonas mirosovicensis]MCH8686688.1 SRPBCC family protein [Pedomonas mirosovicensis]